METPTQSFGRKTESDADKFATTAARSIKGASLGTGFGTWLKGWGALIGISMLASTIEGQTESYMVYGLAFVCFVYLTLKAAWMAFFGVEGALVEGDCPHCGATVQLKNEEEQAGACPSCRHRLVHREQHLVDVSA